MARIAGVDLPKNKRIEIALKTKNKVFRYQKAISKESKHKKRAIKVLVQWFVQNIKNPFPR